MLIYGTKTIELKTIDLPVACTNCAHDHQKLQIYRKFLSLYFIPILPLRKKGVVYCPCCHKEAKQGIFFKELASKGLDPLQAKYHFKSILKATKTPLYMYLLPFLLLVLFTGVIAYSFYESQQNKLQLKEYLLSPVGNVIAVIQSETDAYPYHIMYIAEISEQKAVIFDWKYSYESKGDATKAVDLAYKSIDKNNLKADFEGPYMVSAEIVKLVDIVYIRVLRKAIDWK